MSTKLVLIYALLLVLLSLTLSSCFLFQKHKTITKSTTDSTAYSKIESSTVKHQEEAWKNYLNNQDSSSTSISFGFIGPTDSMWFHYDNWVKMNPDGSIEAKGNIKDVVHKSGKQTTKKDSGSLKTDIATKYVRVKYDIVKTITLNKTKTVERKPDYWGVTLWGLGILALIALVWLVWRNWFRFPIPF